MIKAVLFMSFLLYHWPGISVTFLCSLTTCNLVSQSFAPIWQTHQLHGGDCLVQRPCASHYWDGPPRHPHCTGSGCHVFQPSHPWDLSLHAGIATGVFVDMTLNSTHVTWSWVWVLCLLYSHTVVQYSYRFVITFLLSLYVSAVMYADSSSTNSNGMTIVPRSPLH